ncbi:MAG TPA: hypothetical protein VG733_04695 [Chthoniobacteraceae bacterium]|nr:hypothetical protein [Chthoniobacteraceae bacterium]
MNEAYTKLESRIVTLMESSAPSETEFNECALEVYRFQRGHNQPYDNYCSSLGAAANPEAWYEIPAVPQSAFKQFALRAFPEGETVRTFRTSGTTGEGFGSHHFCSMRLYDEAIVQGWRSLNLPRRPFYFLSQNPKDAPHSSLCYMFGVLGDRLAGRNSAAYLINRDGNFDLGTMEALLRVRAKDRRPVTLLGTALAFLNFFEQLGRRVHVLPEGSFAMETGGYKGSGRSLEKAGLYSLFTRHLGLAPAFIINEYGMTELSSQFYTRGIGNPHQSSPWARAVVIDPETNAEAAIGATGVLRIFDLANLGSVMAIQTQDLAIRREKGFELIGRDPSALPRGCSRSADEMLSRANTAP